MNFKAKKTLKIISNTLVVLVVLLAFLLHGLKLFGLTPYSVLSGSMESVYPTGSLIYVAKTDPEKLKVGDAITFKMESGTIATHRIVELVADEENRDIIRFRTKGDENKIVDGPLVEFDRIVGKPVMCIPLLGYLATYILYPPGKYVGIAVAVVLVLIEIIISIILGPDKKTSKPDKDKK